MTPLEIIYADQHMIVINKPPGIAVHGGVSVFGETLVDSLLQQFPEIRTVGDDSTIRPGIVHRLDKDTSGIMVIARTQESFEILKNIFKTRQVQKTYLAIICGNPKQKTGIITFPIGRLIKNPLKRGADTPGRPTVIRGAREAYTEYRVLKTGQTYSLIELKPKTGRMHQLRVHLKALGTPIACDRIYGGKQVCCPTPNGRQLLHAQSLTFSFPDAGSLFFEADPPEDFRLALNAIEGLAQELIA
ncbi:MAG: RluA family pseudouridine synthase [Candidatus Sungbacteria bacterium]|nr:RluA family pseudouridine synthase [Candidatus Sungbacteria bacterium]